MKRFLILLTSVLVLCSGSDAGSPCQATVDRTYRTPLGFMLTVTPTATCAASPAQVRLRSARSGAVIPLDRNGRTVESVPYKSAYRRFVLWGTYVELKVGGTWKKVNYR